jgi:ribonucleotide monophosphatase NagD (HAD superfamily)
MDSIEVLGKFAVLQQAIELCNNLLGALPRETWSLAVDIDDTLIFDDGRSSLNNQVVTFVQELQKAGAKVHLITARSKDMDRATKNELSLAKIKYTTLDVSPERARGSVKTTSEWKYSKRKEYALAEGQPMALSIGDQWTDLVRVSSDADLEALERKYNVPWCVVKINDENVTRYGLKLYSP